MDVRFFLSLDLMKEFCFCLTAREEIIHAYEFHSYSY